MSSHNLDPRLLGMWNIFAFADPVNAEMTRGGTLRVRMRRYHIGVERMRCEIEEV